MFSGSTSEVRGMSSGLILNEGKFLSKPPSGRVGNVIEANDRGDRINPGIRILPLPSNNDLLGGRMSGLRSEKLLIFRMGNYLWRRMNHKLANRMRMWKGNGNTITLLFSLKGFEILHQERRGQVTIIVMNGFSITIPDLLTRSTTIYPINQ